MNEVQLFNFENNNVRALLINDEPWFVGKDVAEVLGYSNSRDALARHIDDEDKADVVIHDGSQNRTFIRINESGLYSLIFSSKLPQAKKFKRWVTSEVLPKIRKTGSYSTNAVEHIGDPTERLANIISKCTMVEQVDLIRDLYSIPKNTPKKPLALKNKDILNEEDRYKTIDAFIKSHRISEGDLMKDVYHDYCEYCHARNVTPRTRQAFVLRMKQLTRLYTLNINNNSVIQRRSN